MRAEQIRNTFSYLNQMERILEVLDIVPGDSHFFSGGMAERQEKGAIVLILDFLDHGKVHDVALVRAEEAQGGEERLDVAERHLRLDDPSRRIEESANEELGMNVAASPRIYGAMPESGISVTRP